jgi:hypothetical protein
MMPRMRSFLLLSAILAASACGDRELTTPTPPAVGSTAPSVQAATQSRIVAAVRILKRTKALKTAVTTSALIGPAGGRLSIPEAGVEVDFAPGAVDKATRITLTATEGTDVAYEFQPHGLKFSALVVVRQDLKKTTAESDAPLAASLQGSYFEGSLAANLIGTHDVYSHIKEGRSARVNAAGQFLEFTIEHFSGYMLSTGLVAVDISIDWEAQ